MTSSILQDKILRFIRSNLLFLMLAFFGFIFFSFGLIQFLGRQEPEIEFEKGYSIQGVDIKKEGNQIKTSQITIDVSGAVVSPGVYTLSQDSRIQDALIAAGGVGAHADRGYISKQINLAQKLVDGSKIYIPLTGEVPVGQVIGAQTVLGGSTTININSASGTELESLPGVGEVTAEKIIDGRPYSSVEELVSKKIVGASTFEKIKDQVSLY